MYSVGFKRDAKDTLQFVRERVYEIIAVTNAFLPEHFGKLEPDFADTLVTTKIISSMATYMLEELDALDKREEYGFRKEDEELKNEEEDENEGKDEWPSTV